MMRFIRIPFLCALILAMALAGIRTAAQNQKPAAAPGSPAAAPGSKDSSTGQSPATPSAASGSADENAAVVRMAMRNVQYHLTDRIILHITTLDGKLTQKPGQIPVFDDKNSFGLTVDTATIQLSMTALTNDLNDFVFAKPDAPIKHLTASTEGDQLVMKGLLVSKGGIPFKTSGTMSVTPEGMIRVHTTKVTAVHLPVKGLMDMLGLDTQKLLNTKKVEGVSVDKDDLILDPEDILPPPQLRGHLTGLKVENGVIDLVFGPETGKQTPAPIADACGARNYLHFKGGTVRFGKLTMNDTDLELMDVTPGDPFDFAIDHYNDQLVAGESKITPAGGLCVHMPDYNKLQQPPPTK